MPVMSGEPGPTSTYDPRNLLISSATTIGWAILVAAVGGGIVWASIIGFPNSTPSGSGCNRGYPRAPLWLVLEVVAWLVVALVVPFLACRGHQGLGLLVALVSAAVPALVLTAIITSPHAVTGGFCF